MSFGGGFSGFGSNNNTQSSGGFGFGANKTNNNTGFGSAFGSASNTTGSTLFGAGSTTGGGFGSGTGGFGSTSNNPLGGTSGFGSNPGGGGGLFGSNNNSNSGGGFGGFGNTSSNTNTSFGSGGGGGGLFGNQNKTSGGFGSTTNASGSIFGGGGTSTGAGGFGTSSGGAFGTPNSTALSSNVGSPPGTGTVDFQPFQEKEGTSNTINSFQNILFQNAYKNFSPEELRLADYMQGRRHGTASGAGAFGVSSGFGGSGFSASNNNASTGFGASNTTGTGGLFGNSTSTSALGGFGSTTATSGGFGSGSSGGGGLFGQNKPATSTGGGLFGSNSNATGGFGTANTGGAFGGNTSANTGGAFGANTSGGGLFGSTTANQSKSTGFGGFGTGNTNTSGAFGSNNANTGFGTTTANTSGGGGLFGAGGTTQSNSTGAGLFGSTNQQNNPTPGAFGTGFGSTNNPQSSSGGGLFGGASNQSKPGGLFGTSTNSGTAGGGLFGNTTASSNTFGGAGAQSSGGGGLFGNTKPVATGGGLFGTSTQQQNSTSTSGGLFGALGQTNQPQQSTGGGIFGPASQAQPKPSLFGTPAQQNSGSGLFGGTQSTTGQGGGSMFAHANSQPQQQNPGLGNSLFNAPQNNGQPGQQNLNANINDTNAYGNSSLFLNLGANEPQNPGPLATPLSNKSKPRRSSILPMYKLNPASASRLSTPQKRGGFGFSYSTYGTPGSASSVNSTPGSLNQSFLLGNGTRGLKSSVSTSNLRHSFNAEESILTPGAFSTSNQRFGSVKKLVINREMRSDLFATPQKDKPSDSSRGSRLRKHVSFEDSNSESDSTPLPLPAPSVQPSPAPNNMTIVKTSSPNNGNNNAEDSIETPRLVRPAASPNTDCSDPTPGKYWTEPPVGEILKMSQSERAAVEFTVGRQNVGSIQFLEAVDLTGVDVENLFRDTIELEPRSATVYQNPAKKPPVGKGMNVPAKISLEQSWPRNKKSDGKSQARIKKHVDRLRRIPDTTFIDYNQDNGVWTFRVEHFTTYGLDYNDEDEDSDSEPLVDVETANSALVAPNYATRPVVASPGVDPDDTFEFRRKRRALPGAFNREEYFEHETLNNESSVLSQSLSPDRSAGSVSSGLISVCRDSGTEDPYDIAEDPGLESYNPSQPQAVGEECSRYPESGALPDPAPETPGGIMRARMRAIKDSTLPTNVRVVDGDDWQVMLRRTISPQKRDRPMLKSLRSNGEYGKHGYSSREEHLAPRGRMAPQGKGFATSIDLMNSLFDRAGAPGTEHTVPGFVKWPYERKKTCDETDMSPQEQAFHNSVRPTWGPDGTLVFATVPRSRGKTLSRTSENKGLFSLRTGSGISSKYREIRLGQFSNESAATALREQIQLTQFQGEGRTAPFAKLPSLGGIGSVFRGQNLQDPSSVHEKLAWKLAGVLFDDLSSPDGSHNTEAGMTRLRRQKLSDFWRALVDDATTRCVAMARSSEEKAIACLSGYRIPEACKHLLNGRNFRLATIVSTVGTSDRAKADMQEQLRQWRDNKYLSEFSEPIRALYGLTAGEVFVCLGKENGPVEDRLSTFAISSRFGLDWKQAFGLRLWYALSSRDGVDVAVKKYLSDLEKGEMPPRTWYAEEGITPIWKDKGTAVREDLLWGLLKLYADPSTDLEAVLRPENSRLSPLDFRLTWQLGRALLASGKVSFGSRANEKADSATVAFASQLVNEGSWLEASFVLLHLSDPGARARALKDHIARHARHIGDESSDSFATLVSNFKIPASWLWEAKALYARSVLANAKLEAQCLLKAGAYNDAHRTLVRCVAPQAILERDYQHLADLLAQFWGRESRISDWRLGAEVYRDFLSLLGLQGRPSQASDQLAEKLLGGLPAAQAQAQAQDAGDASTSGSAINDAIEATAAAVEMGNIVAKMVIELSRKGQKHEIAGVLQLPLTKDSYLKHSMHISLSYYRELLVDGR